MKPKFEKLQTVKVNTPHSVFNKQQGEITDILLIEKQYVYRIKFNDFTRLYFREDELSPVKE